MDQVTKIITALGIGITAAAAIGVIMSWLKFCSIKFIVISFLPYVLVGLKSIKTLTF